jgi:long-chain acyl-CoA synthetase
MVPKGAQRSGVLEVEMSSGDHALPDSQAAREAWRWLAERYPGRLTPDSSLRSDLGLDSLDWLQLALEIERRAGIRWSDEAIVRTETVRDLLREAASAPAAAGTSFLDAPEAHLDHGQRRWIEPLGPLETRFASALYVINRLIMRGVFRLRVEGVDRLPDRQLVFAPTHGSFLDPFVLTAALSRARLANIFWIADAGLAFGNPLNRQVSRMAQALPLDAERGFVSGVAMAAAVLGRGHELIWFPEGQRSRSGELQEFRPGIGLLLRHYPVPVVPIAIRGAHEAYPPGRIIPRPRPVAVTFGEPLDPAELERQGEGEGAERRIANALWRHTAELYDRTRPATTAG